METQALFAKLAVGEAIPALGVELVPLLLVGADPQADALLLDEAISGGQTVVDEVSAGGVVGQVRVLHRGALPLLVLQGEQILGAKQNRSFNASFVIAPGKEVVLPVSCVEQGRWERKSASFQASRTTLSPEIRARKLKRVSDSITLSGSYDADQRGVWSDVAAYAAATGTHSVTQSYEDARRSQAPAAERASEGLEPCPGQTGLAVVRNGRLVMLDVFGSSRLFARAFKKCVQSALSDASVQSEAAPRAQLQSAVEVVTQALAQIRDSSAARAPSPADGDTWTGRAASVTYTAAVWNGSVYHCAAAG